MKNKLLWILWLSVACLDLGACTESPEPAAPDAAIARDSDSLPEPVAKGAHPAEPGKTLVSPKGLVAARVNGVDILRKDLEETLEHAERAMAMRGSLGSVDSVKLEEQVLKKMIADELLNQHAHSLGLSVSDEEVDSKAAILVEQGGGQKALEGFLALSGMDEQKMKLNLRRNMLVERLHDRIRAEIRLDEDSLRAHFDKFSDKFSGAGLVELEHIVFKGDEGGQPPLRRAEEVRSELAKGLLWEEALKKYGQQGGGSLGQVQAADLLPVFVEAIDGLGDGQVSAPVESPVGVHLLRVVSRAAGPLRSFEQVQEQVQKDLLGREFERRMSALMDELGKKGEVRTAGLP